MQRGERASWRGRGRNILASSSNIMTPATTSTIRTHTDRYTWAAAARICLVLKSFFFFSCYLFFPPKQQSFPGGEGRNERGSSLGVTNVFPQHKSRTQAFLCVCVSVSVSVSRQDSTPTAGLQKAIPSFSVHLSSPSYHLLAFCLSVLSVCLCWHEEKPVRICLLLQ